jgi:molybdopterin molybdotransferase
MLELKTVNEARKILGRIDPIGIETIASSESLDRYIADDIIAPEDLPSFDKAMMDGYALRAEDTFGAGDVKPVSLSLVGEVKIGQLPTRDLKKGEAIKINTGAMMPKGANSVEMLEYVEEKDGKIVAGKSLTPGENITRRGDDIKKEEVLLVKGQKIRSQDIGALNGLGIINIKVFKKPRVAIIPTGDELIEPEERPEAGQIRNMNLYSLSAQVQKCGGEPIPFGIVRDDFPTLKEKIGEALAKADILLISGGSSVGTHDLTLKVLQSLAGGKVLTQGVAIKPGKPTIIAKVEEKVVFGLPGNPVSVMIVFRKIVAPAILAMMDAKERLRVVNARLARTVTSSTGREEYIRVRLEEEEGSLVALPLPRSSGNIVSLVKADGLLKIPRLSEGIRKDRIVEVELWD